jgi:hypothetical protein
MILVFSTCKQNPSSQFFDLEIENPLGGGTLAKIESSLYRAYRNLVLCLPRLTVVVVVSIGADRPGAWFRGQLGTYPPLFHGIGLSRQFEPVDVPGNLMKITFCVGVFWG